MMPVTKVQVIEEGDRRMQRMRPQKPKPRRQTVAPLRAGVPQSRLPGSRGSETSQEPLDERGLRTFGQLWSDGDLPAALPGDPR